ncbi:MAG: homoaconitate hydratase family protein, partial [Thermoproteota archaeon]
MSDAGLTMAEKILSKKVGRNVTPGENVIVDVDLVMAHDGTAPLAIEKLSEMGVDEVFDPSRTVLVIDHTAPSPSDRVSNIHNMMRDFASKTGVQLKDVGCGVCHQLLIEEFVEPWTITIGADSHTCTHGALGSFATGMGSTDVAVAMAYGETWLKVPESLKVEVSGKLRWPLTSKDVILYTIGELGAAGATYRSIEFLGGTVKEMDMASRFTLTNMAIEAGAKTGFCPVDDKAQKFLLETRGESYQKLKPDPDAAYIKKLSFDVDELEPMIAAPHTVDNVHAVTEFEGMKIDQVFIGTCTNGRFQDLLTAAKILEGQKVSKDLRLIVQPASRGIYSKAI